MSWQKNLSIILCVKIFITIIVGRIGMIGFRKQTPNTTEKNALLEKDLFKSTFKNMENENLMLNQNDLIQAIVKNLEWILRTDEMIAIKQSAQDRFGVEQYLLQKNKLLADLQDLYALLNVQVDFRMVA